MTDSAASVPCVTATLPPETADALFEIIGNDGFTPTSWYDVESGVCRVSLFPDEPDGVARTQAALLAAAELLGVTVEPTVTAVAQTDWAESWKRFSTSRKSPLVWWCVLRGNRTRRSPASA